MRFLMGRLLKQTGCGLRGAEKGSPSDRRKQFGLLVFASQRLLAGPVLGLSRHFDGAQDLRKGLWHTSLFLTVALGSGLLALEEVEDTV